MAIVSDHRSFETGRSPFSVSSKLGSSADEVQPLALPAYARSQDHAVRAMAAVLGQSVAEAPGLQSTLKDNREVEMAS